MHPALILLVGVVCETLVQFGKRAVYLFSSSSSAHYGMLLAGDFVFVSLFAMMLSHLSFQRRHWIVIGIFFYILLFTCLVSGPAATILAVRNTYLWIFFTVLFAISVTQPIGRCAASSLVGGAQLLSAFLLVFAIIQVQSDYAFEKPWFEYSGTSLNYDGVTNFGQAAKAFSLFGGPTDFAVFGLFMLCIGIASNTWSLGLLGAIIIVMSGTRGILVAIPVWAVMVRTSVDHVRRNYLIGIAVFFVVVFLFSDELITLLYAMPNSRFSLATLAPRIQLWLDLDPTNFVIGGGLAANLALDNLSSAPNVIDSGLIYFLSEIGAPLTIALVYILLTAAQRDLLGSRKGALQLFLGVLLIASIAQIPLHTRLSNFFICLLIYSGIYHAKKT